jgi:hypothetical protein
MAISIQGRSEGKSTTPWDVNCLDWTIVRGRGHLERLLRIYTEHYNDARPHRGLNLATPNVPTPEPNQRRSGLQFRRRDLLGGLIHEYDRAADGSEYWRPSGIR